MHLNFKKRFISIHRPSRIMFFFPANYVPKIPDYANFKHKLLLFQFNKLANPLWFYSEYKFIHFQSENTEEKVVLPPSKSKRSAFFFFSKL